MGVVGTDFVVVASDTRLAADYSIDCRHKSRVFKLTSKCMAVITGFEGDIDAIVSRLRIAIWNYQQEHFKELVTESAACLVSTVLYSKRFLPYYVNVILAGIDSAGTPALYGYDPVGCIERHHYIATGTGCALGLPILDLAFGEIHRCTTGFPYPTLDKAKEILRDAICSAAERDIYTGDNVEIAVFTNDGMTIEEYPLPAH
jgi:20S proteasome subunit beta 6